MDGQPDRRSADELTLTGCYFHPDRPSRYQCCWCGRGLCLDSARRVEGADYCPECDPARLCPVFICGCCGTIAYAASEPCPGCGRTETFRQRRPASPDSPWESESRALRGGHLESFALVWVLVFTGGLVLGIPLPLRGVSLPPSWWAILLGACTASGTMAAMLSRRSGTFRLFLSPQGIRVRARGKSTDFLNWNEITRLEWFPPSAPRHLTIHARSGRVELDTGLDDWETVTAIIRQHSPIVPPPSTKQCLRRTPTPR